VNPGSQSVEEGVAALSYALPEEVQRMARENITFIEWDIEENTAPVCFAT
jgi:hypothetical protein